MELALAVPQVVTHRLLRMATAGSRPSARDRHEFWLMGAEKIEALGESWNAVFFEVFRTNLTFALSFAPQWWFGWPTVASASRAATRHWERTAIAALVKGIAPVRRRAVANARRLSRKRRP